MDEHERAYLRMQQARSVARPAARQYAFHGELLTVSEIATRTGLSRDTIRRRIRNNRPIDAPARHGLPPLMLAFRGRQATIKEIVKETGLSRTRISERHDGLRYFEDHELRDPNAPLREDARPICYKGTVDSLAGWGRRTGISRWAIRTRLDQLGWSVERALTEPSMSRGKRALYRRNALLIKRMLKALSTEPLQDHAPQNPDQTGGQSRTFPQSPRTGVCPSKTDFEGARA